jgi:hypothetical protein
MMGDVTGKGAPFMIDVLVFIGFFVILLGPAIVGTILYQRRPGEEN